MISSFQLIRNVKLRLTHQSHEKYAQLIAERAVYRESGHRAGKAGGVTVQMFRHHRAPSKISARDRLVIQLRVSELGSAVCFMPRSRLMEFRTFDSVQLHLIRCNLIVSLF